MRLCIDATPVVSSRKGIGVVLEGLIDAAPPGSPIGKAHLFVDAAHAGELEKRWPGRALEPVRMRSSLLWETISLPAELRKGKCRVLLTMRERTLAPSGTRHLLWLFEIPDRRVELILAGGATPVQRLVARHSLGRFGRVTKRVAHFIVSSDSTRRDLLERYAVADDRVSVIYPGLPHGIGEFDQRGDRSSPAGTGRYVLHFATGDARDNTPVALSSFAALRGRIADDVRLVLAGAPESIRGDLQSRARSLGIENRTVILGYIPSPRMPALFAAADVYFDPTLFEGFGLQLVEAMACGTPVVASNTTSVPEVVGAGGILAAPGDEHALAAGLASILGDQRVRDALSAAAREESRRFSWPNAVDEVSKLIERLDG